MEEGQRWRGRVVESGDREGAGEQQEYGRRLGCLERTCRQVADTVKRVSHADGSNELQQVCEKCLSIFCQEAGFNRFFGILSA